jgi:dTDP-4-dehydrorhamnose reductase
LAEWALKSFKEGKTIKGFNDVVFNPLYARQLADLLLRLIDTDLEGRLHVGCLENMSKFRFLKEVASAFGYPEMLVAESVSPVDNALRKPRDTTLDINYLKKVLNVLPSISTGLQMLKADYLKLV